MEELASLVPTESKSRFVEEFQELISKDSVGTSMSACVPWGLGEPVCRNLLVKEFCYLRTVNVTAAV